MIPESQICTKFRRGGIGYNYIGTAVKVITDIEGVLK